MRIYNRFAKSFKNKTSWTQMTWWKTNFNMPVPNIFDDGSTYTETEWMLDGIWVATSFDLSWYNYWWEICAATTTFTLDWPYDWWTIYISQEWRKPNWTLIFTNWPYSWNPWSVSSWDWVSYQMASNQWVAPWEVDISWTYTCKAIVTWWITQEETFDVDFTNVPSFLWYKTPWYTWVESDKLCYVWANWFVHKIEWEWSVDVWSGKAWFIWIDDNSDSIRWIDETWIRRNLPWSIKQFASAFSNWAPWSVSWQYPWYIYCDNQFWWTHLSYIDKDWDKQLAWDGNYPYIDPY